MYAAEFIGQLADRTICASCRRRSRNSRDGAGKTHRIRVAGDLREATPPSTGTAYIPSSRRNCAIWSSRRKGASGSRICAAPVRGRARRRRLTARMAQAMTPARTHADEDAREQRRAQILLASHRSRKAASQPTARWQKPPASPAAHASLAGRCVNVARWLGHSLASSRRRRWTHRCPGRHRPRIRRA